MKRQSNEHPDTRGLRFESKESLRPLFSLARSTRGEMEADSSVKTLFSKSVSELTSEEGIRVGDTGAARGEKR